MPGPVFERGERVTLRPIERDDAAFLQRGQNHPEVRTGLGRDDPKNGGQVSEDIQGWIEGRDSVNLLVCRDGERPRAESGRDPDAGDPEPTPMGLVNLKNVHRARPLLSYWLLPEYQGEGYATEALELLLDYFFDTYDRRGVQANVFSHNDASGALLERLGFTREARLRKNCYIEGSYRDQFVFGLLAEEWRTE